MHKALKVGKPLGTNFSSPTLSSNYSTQQSIRACNTTSPAESWHYPLHFHTTLRVVDTFSMLLKLMFYQNTYIGAVFQRAHGLSLGFPSSDITTSFPIQQQELYNQPHTILHWFTIAKLTGKCGQLFFRHQSTSRLTFNFCCVISVTHGKVKIKPSPTAQLTSGHFPLADYQSGWGKTSRHHSQCLPQAFAYYHLLTNWFLFSNYRQW